MSKEVELTEAQKEAICYRSKLLNRYFDNYDEMVKAEDEYNKAHAAELKKAEERKVRAKEVEDAYKAAIEVRKQAKEIIEEANRKASEMIRNAEGHYNQLKDTFVKDYGSFHMTYTNDNGREDITISDVFDEAFKNFFRLW